MKRLASALALILITGLAYGQTFLTNTTTKTLNIDQLSQDFGDWTFYWNGYEDQSVTYTITNNSGGVDLDGLFAQWKASRRNSAGSNVVYIIRTPSQMTVTNATISFTLSKTNIPPDNTYKSQLILTDGTTNEVRNLGRGKVVVTESLFDDDDGSWQNPNITNLTDYLTLDQAATLYETIATNAKTAGYIFYNNDGTNNIWKDPSTIASIGNMNTSVYDTAGVATDIFTYGPFFAANALTGTMTDATQLLIDHGKLNAASLLDNDHPQYNDASALTSSLPSAVQQAIVQVGTVTQGVWQGTAIGDTYLTKTGDWTGTLDGYEAAEFGVLAETNSWTMPQLTTIDHMTTAPASDEFGSAEWVRSLLSFGKAAYMTTNPYAASWPPTNTTAILSYDVPTAVTITVAVAADAYVRTMVDTNPVASDVPLQGPATFNLNLAIGSGVPAANYYVTLKPEVYWTYDLDALTVTNGDFDAQPQTWTSGESDTKSFVVSWPTVQPTGTYYRVYRLKCTDKGSAISDVQVVVGGSSASHVDFQTGGAEASAVQANLDAHEADLANPHVVTLQQAANAGNTATNPIVLGSTLNLAGVLTTSNSIALNGSDPTMKVTGGNQLLIGHNSANDGAQYTLYDTQAGAFGGSHLWSLGTNAAAKFYFGAAGPRINQAGSFNANNMAVTNVSELGIEADGSQTWGGTNVVLWRIGSIGGTASVFCVENGTNYHLRLVGP